MVRYFRSCKQVTVGCGGAGFVTGFLVTLGLLLPIYDDIGVEYAKDSHKNNYRSTLGTTTQKFNMATKKASVIKATEIPNVTCKLTKIGHKYRGFVNITREGIPCQHWIDNYPHKRWNALTIQKFPDDSFVEAKNYCRSPHPNPEGPWCYTMDPDVRLQYCDIKMCSMTTNK